MSQFSKNSDIAKSNLEAIKRSPTYQIAHEDQQFLNGDEMRGVRMLLEISKPEQHSNWLALHPQLLCLEGRELSIQIMRRSSLLKLSCY